jgi:hypothetical protein
MSTMTALPMPAVMLLDSHVLEGSPLVQALPTKDDRVPLDVML